MKFRSRDSARGYGRLAAALIRTTMATAKVRESVEAPEWHPWMGGADRGFLVATWHENSIPAAWLFGRFGHVFSLASTSLDGEFAAVCAETLGVRVLRGSSTQRGVGALKQVMDMANYYPIFRFGVTPDGPRGPRRSVKPGTPYLASRTGLPVIAVGIACERAWRTRSWDRTQIPRPFQQVRFHWTTPMWIEPGLSRDALEAARRRIEAEMNRAQRCAEAYLSRSTLGRRRQFVAQQAA